jgi:hypothetical protein
MGSSTVLYCLQRCLHAVMATEDQRVPCITYTGRTSCVLDSDDLIKAQRPKHFAEFNKIFKSLTPTSTAIPLAQSLEHRPKPPKTNREPDLNRT